MSSPYEQAVLAVGTSTERKVAVGDMHHHRVLGVIIVGEAQAGKTTLRTIIDASWTTTNPGSTTLSFSNSDGFRGSTAKILARGEVDLSAPIVPEDYLRLLDDFVTATPAPEFAELLDDLYRVPLDKDILRSPAVNTAVPLTSEDPRIRPLVNVAGARYLAGVLDDPGSHGLQQQPGLVILDARNVEECNQKFTRARVQGVGRFILACPEEVAARRIVGNSASMEESTQEAARLRDRNQTDRARCLGRMTVSADFSQPLLMDELLAVEDSRQGLIEAGKTLATDMSTGMVIRTDRISLDAETLAVSVIMEGILMTVGINPKKPS